MEWGTREGEGERGTVGQEKGVIWRVSLKVRKIQRIEREGGGVIPR